MFYMRKDYEDLTPAQARCRNDLTYVDVREPDERVTGPCHVEGSVSIPLSELTRDKIEAKVSHETPVLMICRSGRRSARAAEMLLEWGYQKVHNLEGGMMSWAEQRLPTTCREKQQSETQAA